MNRRISSEIRLVALGIRNAFVAILPYLVLNSVAILLFSFVSYIDLWPTEAIKTLGSNIVATIQKLFPIMALLAIAYHLAKQYDINRLSSVTLAVAVSAVLGVLLQGKQSSHSVAVVDASLLAICVPLVSTVLLQLSIRRAEKRDQSREVLSGEIAGALTQILPMLQAFALSILIAMLIRPLIDIATRELSVLHASLSPTALLIELTIVGDLLWFLGIHGFNVSNLIFNLAPLDNPLGSALSYRQYLDLYVFFGGSGAVTSLVIALLVGSRDNHSKRIAKIASPFVLFNISEIVVFGLPVILNRYLFLPFIGVPLVNIAISWWFIASGQIHFFDHPVSWTTPVLLNAYLMSGGSFQAVLLQVLCVLVGAAIYYPFVRAYTGIQSTSHQRRELAAALDISAIYETQETRKFQEAQKAIIDAHAEIENIISLFKKNRLTVYYQPKVDLLTSEGAGFEALLRLELANGKIVGPYFLDAIEAAGMATVMDHWVCRQVKHDLAIWHADGFSPRVAVNLHPDTVLDRQAIEDIARILEGELVDFEVVERGNLDMTEARDNLTYLKTFGFRISLDDFGTGYAGFAPLNALPIDVVKLDKSLIDASDNECGRTIYFQAAELCDKLGLECIAEGIEHEAQVDLLRQSGVRYIQGYYYAPALSRDQARSFRPKGRE